MQPFAREILLIECHIARTSFRELEEIEPNLSPGYFLKREPHNPQDPLAISIFDEAANDLGNISRIKNEALVHLMDASKLPFGRLESKECIDDWLRLDIQIFMRDY